jgi:hypothetical protein
MLDALGIVWGQVAIVVAIAALCAGLLGWLIGSRRSRSTSRATPGAVEATPAAAARLAESPSAHQEAPAPWTPVTASRPETTASWTPPHEPVAEPLDSPAPSVEATVGDAPAPWTSETESDPQIPTAERAQEPARADHSLGEPTVTWAPFTQPRATQAPVTDDTTVLAHSALDEDASLPEEAVGVASWPKVTPATDAPDPSSAPEEPLREAAADERPVPGYRSDEPESWFAEEPIVLAPSLDPSPEDPLADQDVNGDDAADASPRRADVPAAEPGPGQLRDNSDPEAWFVEHPVPAAPVAAAAEDDWAAEASVGDDAEVPEGVPDPDPEPDDEAADHRDPDADPDEVTSPQGPDDEASPGSDPEEEALPGSDPEEEALPGSDPEEADAVPAEDTPGPADAAEPVETVATTEAAEPSSPEPGQNQNQPSPAGTLPDEPAEIADLKRQLLAMERELARLEGGAVSAWDATVPHLEQRIEQLQRDNADLQSALRRALDDLQTSAHEVGSLRHTLSEQRTLLDDGEQP